MLKQVQPGCLPARLLNALHALEPQALEAVTRAAGGSTREIHARRDVIREGERPRSILFVLQGWGCRYKHLPDGRRQIVSIMLPGDMCDADMGSIERIDHSIGALTAMKVGEIGFDAFRTLREDHPGLSLAIARYERMKAAAQREWITSLGQRTAIERISHLCCELFLRLQVIGAVEDRACEFPLTQSDIADACGLTSVHVNRTIQELRREGLIAVARRQIVIPDLASLMDRALFDPHYLQLAQPLTLLRNG